MERKLIKRWYRFLCDHSVGVIRTLYLAPVPAVLTCNETILGAVLLACAAVSITYQVGNAARWNQVRCESCKHCDFGGWSYAVCRKRSNLHNMIVHKGEYCNFAEERIK